MHFVGSVPWFVKVLCVLVPWVKRSAHTPSPNMLRVPFALTALLLLSVALPSLLFSVRDRARTTEFFAQTLLFVYAAGVLVCAVQRDAAHRAYAGLAAQLLLMHLFYSCSAALRRSAALTLYPGAFQAICVLGFGAVFAVYSLSTPHVELELMPTLGALFAPELAGLAVLIASGVMRALAEMYEQVLDRYA